MLIWLHFHLVQSWLLTTNKWKAYHIGVKVNVQIFQSLTKAFVSALKRKAMESAHAWKAILSLKADACSVFSIVANAAEVLEAALH